MPPSPNRFVISVDSVYPDPVGRLRVRLVFLCFPKPSTFDSRPSLFPKSFSCNTYGYPRKCCKQKTYSMVKLLRCNAYKKQAGWGGAIVLPGRISIPVRCPDLSPLVATLTKTA